MRGKAGAFSRRILQPTSFAGLTGWWDASDSSTLFNATSGGSAVAADGAVARLEDKSGNGRHWTQSTSSYRPVRKTSVRNGLDVLRFDGSDDYLNSSSWLWQNIVSSTAHTILAVAVASSVATDFDLPFENAAIVGNREFGATSIFYFRSSDVVATSGINGFWFSGSNSYAAGNWAQFTSAYSASTLQMRVNKTGGGTDGSISQFQDLNTGAQLGSGYTVLFHGDLAELVTYNVALSASDREAVESYLMDKWAIT